MPDRGVPFALNATSAMQPDLFPLALAPVREQEVLDRVVGDEQIHQAVVVDVGGDDAERLADRARMSVPALTSVNVPSPLLWNSRLGVGLKTRGMQ